MLAGKEKKVSIGKYPTISLLEARETAAKMLTKVRQGIDPTAKVEIKKKITFGEITISYIQLAAKRKSVQRIFKIQQGLMSVTNSTKLIRLKPSVAQKA
jgi:hypothetical protein